MMLERRLRETRDCCMSMRRDGVIHWLLLLMKSLSAMVRSGSIFNLARSPPYPASDRGAADILVIHNTHVSLVASVVGE